MIGASALMATRRRTPALDQQGPNVDVRRFLAITRKWLPLLVACTVLAAGAALVVSQLQQRTYEAKTTLIVGQALTSANPDYTGLLASQQLSTTYAAIATTRPQLQAVIDELGLPTTPDDLSRRVTADTSSGSTLLVISVKDSDAARAAATANALADRLISKTASIQGRQADIQAAIDADLASTQDQITTTQQRVTELVGKPNRTAADEAELSTLEGQLVTLRSTYSTLLGFSSVGSANLLSVIEPAVAPTDAISPKPLLNVLVAAVLGLLLAAGIALLAELLDESVGGVEEVERLTGASVLASINPIRVHESQPEALYLAALTDPWSRVVEAYRTLRTNLEFAGVDRQPRSILVTSAREGEGKTVTATNLASVYALAGRRVLLIDADLRRPRIHAAVGLHNEVGLTSALVGDRRDLAELAQATPSANLVVLTSGALPPNPAELLGSQRMRDLIERAVAEFDLVIVDGPPLATFADSALLSSLLDAVLFVVDAERSRRRSVEENIDLLRRAGATVLGVVLNRVGPSTRVDERGGYGGYALADVQSDAADGFGAPEAVAAGALSPQPPAAPHGSARGTVDVTPAMTAPAPPRGRS